MAKLEKYKRIRPISGFKDGVNSAKSGFCKMNILWFFGAKSKYPDGTASAKQIEGQKRAKSMILFIKLVELFDSLITKLLGWGYSDKWYARYHPDLGREHQIISRIWAEYSFLGSVMAGGVFVIAYTFHSKLAVDFWLFIICPFIILLQISREILIKPNRNHPRFSVG